MPIRRAGRSARDEAWVLPHALGGVKSVNGGIYDPSGAAHLHRQFLREVRSEFSWTVIGAAGRSSGTLVCFFCNFSFKQRKVYKTHSREGNEVCAQAEVRAEMRTAEDVGPYNVKSILRADGSYVEGER